MLWSLAKDYSRSVLLFFRLRSGDEHRSLDVEQFSFGVSNGIDVEHIGHTSKTYKDELNQRKLLSKNLRLYAVLEIS